MKITKHTPPPPRYRRATAFTLIETIVATFLAAIMLPAIYASTAAGFALVQVTRENLRATQIIVKQMEAIRLSPYKLLQDGKLSDKLHRLLLHQWQDQRSGLRRHLQMSARTQTLPPSYQNNIQLVTVTAAWSSGKVQRTRSMQTYVARYGIQRLSLQ